MPPFIKADEVNQKLGINFAQLITKVSASDKPKSGSILFHFSDYFDLKGLVDIICFVRGSTKVVNIGENIKIIRCINPKLEYSKFIKNFTYKEKVNYEFVNGSWISENSKIHPDAEIYPGCFIGINCNIGAETVLMPGVKLISNCAIGASCRLGPGTVVGHDGFSIEKDNSKERTPIPSPGSPVRTRHFGGVIIGDNCDIGALNTIASGTIEPTTLGSNVCTDDHVHIAHNCVIKDNVLLTAHSEISGSVTINRDVWVGPNTSIKQKVEIGENSIIGIGANVLHSIPPDTVVYGNPAKAKE